MLAVRLVTTLLGVGLCLPAAVSAATTQKKPVRRAATTQTTTAKKKPATAYSATASGTRRANLARARASARARERVRLRSFAQLREAMTPQYKTDANGDLVPDVRAEAAIV